MMRSEMNEVPLQGRLDTWESYTTPSGRNDYAT
jgi:hypothetical protein